MDDAPPSASHPAPALSSDQAAAWEALSDMLAEAGIDIAAGELSPPETGAGHGSVRAVIGKAGSGKTLLLAQLTRALRAAGVDLVSGDYA